MTKEMVDPWSWNTLASAESLEPTPPTETAEEAQRWCNFGVWWPTDAPLGKAHAVVKSTLRREAPPGRQRGVAEGRSPWSDVNPSAFRFEIEGPGRRLRVKQFLYDWAFPALDHPCLWGNQTRPVALDDSHTLWIGTDYMNHRAASCRLGKSTVELSVLEGVFDDEELVAVYGALRPISADAMTSIAQTAFARLSYWARHRNAMMLHVPIGLWKFQRKRRTYTGAWRDVREAGGAVLASDGLGRELGGLSVDSLGMFEDAEGKLEREWIYSGGPWGGYEVRIIIQNTDGGHIDVPPRPEELPHTADTIEVHGTPVFLAWCDPIQGPFDAVWRSVESGRDVKLVATTGVRLDREWFVQVLADTVEAVKLNTL